MILDFWWWALTYEQYCVPSILFLFRMYLLIYLLISLFIVYWSTQHTGTPEILLLVHQSVAFLFLKKITEEFRLSLEYHFIAQIGFQPSGQHAGE